MDALEKLGWSKTESTYGFFYVNDGRNIYILKTRSIVWDDYGNACSLYFSELLALAEVIKEEKK